MNSNTRKSKPVCPKSAEELLDLYYLDARSALLETAATLDRVERAKGGPETLNGQRVKLLKQACDVIANANVNRIEQLQHIFTQLDS